MRMDNKGFTLIELIVTIVLLAVVMGIGSYSITAVLKTTKEKNYQLLVKEIKKSVELYHQECKYVDGSCSSKITLGFLVDNGYLKGNSDNNDINDLGLVNTTNNENIRDCEIVFTYTGGKMVVEADSQNSTNSCPTTSDYSNN